MGEKDKGKGKVLSDSKGNAHYVIFQEMDTSCALACVAMAESYYKSQCMVNPEKRARELSQKYEGNWTPKDGTDVHNISYVLNAEGVKAYGATFVPQTKLYDYFYAYVGERTPMIADIHWSKGAHATLLRRVYSDGTMVFLDPWFGIVEVKYWNLPWYYAKGAWGQLNGWINITYR